MSVVGEPVPEDRVSVDAARPHLAPRLHGDSNSTADRGSAKIAASLFAVSKNTPRVTVIGLNYAPEPTGIAPYTSGLATGLATRGWAIRAITSFPHYPSWEIADGYSGQTIHEETDGVLLTRLRPYMPRNPSGVKRLLVELSFGVRAIFTRWGHPDVVVLVSPALFATGLALMKARLSPGKPRVIVWVQDLYGLGVSETGAMSTRGARVMTAIEAAVLRHSDVVVAIHDRFKRYMESGLNLSGGRVEVVRNWTHLKPEPVDRDAYRGKFEWGSETVVLHAGNMGAKQALENVVAAARIADSANAAVRFVLLGNGNQREKLLHLSSGVSKIQFVDSLNDQDFQGAMAAADILLVNEKPGVAEMAVPSKLTSYFAAARPVLAATDEGSITAEEISNADAGIRINAGDPQALLDAALSLGANAELSESLGANGARFQERVLSREAAISHYAEIITSLAGTRGRQARASRPSTRGKI